MSFCTRCTCHVAGWSPFPAAMIIELAEGTGPWIVCIDGLLAGQSRRIGRINFAGHPGVVSRNHVELSIHSDSGALLVKPIGTNSSFVQSGAQITKLEKGVAVPLCGVLLLEKSHEHRLRCRPPPPPPPPPSQPAQQPAAVDADDIVHALSSSSEDENEEPLSRSAASTTSGAGAAAGSRSSSSKRPRPAEVIEIGSSDEDEVEGGAAPRIVIDLETSPRSSKPEAGAGASSGGASTIDLTTADDDAFAREVQAQFDVIDVDAMDSAGASSSGGGGNGGGSASGPIDFRALNAARQQRLQTRRRRDGSAAEADSDLLYEQRRGLDSRCAASASKLKLRVSSLVHNAASRPGQSLYERFVSAWQRVPDKTLKVEIAIERPPPTAGSSTACSLPPALTLRRTPSPCLEDRLPRDGRPEHGLYLQVRPQSEEARR